ncbi:hypothetical protein MMC29_000706 [Sticta canariensis]|nr:hypothetical protein [Sticta canariensis]
MGPLNKSDFERDSSDSDQSAGEGMIQSFSESNYSEAFPSAGGNLGQGAQVSEMASSFSAGLPSNPFEDDSAGEGMIQSISESDYSEAIPNAGGNLGQGAQVSEMASSFSAGLPSNPFEDDSEVIPFRIDLEGSDSDTVQVGAESENEELPSRRIVRAGSPMGEGEVQEDNWPPSVEVFHPASATSRQPRSQRRIHPASSQAVRLAKKQTRETPTAAPPAFRSEAEMYLASFHDPESAEHTRNRTAAAAAARRPVSRSAADVYLPSFHDPESGFYRRRRAGTGALDPASCLRRSEPRCASDRLYLPDSTTTIRNH